MSVLPYYLSYLFPLLVAIGFAIGGLGNFLVVAVIFLGVPLLDAVVGTRTRKFDSEQLEELTNRKAFRFVAILYVPIQLGLVIGGAYAVSHYQLSGLEMAGLALSIASITGGIGINYAHELLHKKSLLERSSAYALLLAVHYMHFFVEHMYGHHKNAATPADHATARKGESFYRFWFRSVFGGIKSAWQHERKKGKNRMHIYVLAPTLFAIGLGLLWGWKATAFFYIQSFLAFSLLEAINYVQHYGLLRKKDEKVGPKHAWESRHIISSWLLLQLTPHADHHMHAVKPYQILQHMDESPQLPHGYATMVIIALFPLLWFQIMNPLVEKQR